jgi:hypothetical protein
MTPENFVYWLQGYFELTHSDTLTEEQVIVIKQHIGLVMKKVTPNVDLGWQFLDTKFTGLSTHSQYLC